MKKFLSIVLAVIMSVSVMTIASISAFAVESPTASTAPKEMEFLVNGEESTDIKYTFDDTELPYTATFEYVGPGKLVNPYWEDNMAQLGFVLGVDYTRTVDANGKLILKFLNEESGAAFRDGLVVVNAIVEFDESTSTTKVPVSSNGSSTSPNTGVATSVIAASIAAAGAGIAVLSATKKKDAE